MGEKDGQSEGGDWGNACTERWITRRVNWMRLIEREGRRFHRRCISKSGWWFCNKEDTDGQARMTADEEWVLYVEW